MVYIEIRQLKTGNSLLMDVRILAYFICVPSFIP